mgnify:CR=1 FL=1
MTVANSSLFSRTSAFTVRSPAISNENVTVTFAPGFTPNAVTKADAFDAGPEKVTGAFTGNVGAAGVKVAALLLMTTPVSRSGTPKVVVVASLGSTKVAERIPSPAALDTTTTFRT